MIAYFVVCPGWKIRRVFLFEHKMRWRVGELRWVNEGNFVRADCHFAGITKLGTIATVQESRTPGFPQASR